jgi:hypothetical protein
MQCVRNNKALSKEELYKESGPLSALPLMAPLFWSAPRPRALVCYQKQEPNLSTLSPFLSFTSQFLTTSRSASQTEGRRVEKRSLCG